MGLFQYIFNATARLHHQRKLRIAVLFFLVMMLTPAALLAQSHQVQTTVDKKQILIGEQFTLTIKGIYDPAIVKPHWIVVPDSIPHFDIVDKGKVDTLLYKDNSKAIQQTITLTSFDSGSWVIPAMLLNFDPIIDDTTYTVFTDSIPVKVSFAPADSSNQLRDIKPIMDVSITDYTWYYVGTAILLLLIIVFFIWRYLKNRAQQPITEKGKRVNPYEQAMQELKKLESAILTDAVSIKRYHIKLSEIIKQYLSERHHKNRNNQTTGDLLIVLKETGLSTDDLSSLATVLRCGDAVKFAKYLPETAESKNCLTGMLHSIKQIEQLLAQQKM
jgi:hypothetical protein